MGPELRLIGFALSKQKTKNACMRVPCNGDCAAFCLGAQAGLPVLLKGKNASGPGSQAIVICAADLRGRRLKPTLLKGDCGLRGG